MIEMKGRSEELDAKLSRLRSLLASLGASGAALRSRRNFAWMTAGGDNHVEQASDTGVATLLVTAHDVVVLTSVNEAARIRDEELAGLHIEVVAFPWEIPGAVPAEISRRAPGRVLDDDELEPHLSMLRSVLLEPEVERVAALGARTAAAMTRALRAVRAGDLETIVGERLAMDLAADGIRLPVLLVASDERILKYRHPIPAIKPIEKSLMVAVCAEVRGLFVSMTRFAWLAGEPDPETLRRFRAVKAINLAFAEATVAGRQLSAVLADGIAAYNQQGYPEEWRLHHQGGPIAYKSREAVAFHSSSATIEPGMVFGWNPSITGAKVEDTFVLLPGDGRLVVTVDPSWPVGDPLAGLGILADNR